MFGYVYILREYLTDFFLCEHPEAVVRLIVAVEMSSPYTKTLTVDHVL